MDTPTPENITDMLGVKNAPLEGPGRVWLTDLGIAVAEGINRNDPYNDLEETAENTVPGNPWETWQVFTDLQLWEWVSLGGETVVTENLAGLPGFFLVQFAKQVATMLHDEYAR